MLKNDRPRYWVNWYDRWHVLLPILFLIVCLAGLWVSCSHPLRPTTLQTTGAVLQPDQAQTVSGQAEPNARIRIYANQQLVGETDSDANGNFSLQLRPLPLGAYQLYAVSDLSGITMESPRIAINVAAPAPTIDTAATTVALNAQNANATATALAQTNAQNANATATALAQANAQNANATATALAQANAQNANATATALAQANAQNANATATALAQANAQNANATATALAQANAQNANATATALAQANAQNANATATALAQANAQNANATATALAQANAQNANATATALAQANAQNANATATALAQANAQNANATATALAQANAQNANATATALAQANAQNANATATALAQANAQNANATPKTNTQANVQPTAVATVAATTAATTAATSAPASTSGTGTSAGAALPLSIDKPTGDALLPGARFTGKGAPGATITLSANGKIIGTAVVGANGTWIFVLPGDLKPGAVEFQAVQSAPADTVSVSINIAATTLPTTGNVSSAARALWLILIAFGAAGVGLGAFLWRRHSI